MLNWNKYRWTIIDTLGFTGIWHDVSTSTAKPTSLLTSLVNVIRLEALLSEPTPISERPVQKGAGTFCTQSHVLGNIAESFCIGRKKKYFDDGIIMLLTLDKLNISSINAGEFYIKLVGDTGNVIIQASLSFEHKWKRKFENITMIKKQRVIYWE